jgi:Sigma-70 region 2
VSGHWARKFGVGADAEFLDQLADDTRVQNPRFAPDPGSASHMSRARRPLLTETADTGATVAGNAAPATGVTADKSLRDLLSFHHAQALLVGLVGCTPDQATNAVLVTATELGIDVEDLGVFDDLMSGHPSTHFEAILIRLLGAVGTGADSNDTDAAASSATDLTKHADFLPTHVICGGRVSLGELFDVYGAQCYGVARHIVGNDEQLVCEVVHDVFLAVAQGECWFDARRGSVQTWLLLTTRTFAILTVRVNTAHRSRLGR